MLPEPSLQLLVPCIVWEVSFGLVCSESTEHTAFPVVGLAGSTFSFPLVCTYTASTLCWTQCHTDWPGLPPQKLVATCLLPIHLTRAVCAPGHNIHSLGYGIVSFYFLDNAIFPKRSHFVFENSPFPYFFRDG